MKDGQLVPKGGNGELQTYDPKQGAMKVHAAEAAERAARRAKNVEAFERAVEEKLEAQRDFAAHYQNEFRPSRETGGRTTEQSPGKYVEQFGFHIRTVQRWCNRLLDGAKFQIERHQRLAKVWSIVEMAQAASFSSESVEWYTPRQYIDLVHECLGGIDLDPASSRLANKTVKATKFWTESTKPDVLTRPWSGRVFMNPPYGKLGGDSLAGLFCQKLIEEHQAGNVEETIFLVNSVHSQEWQRAFYDHVVCFVDHRIQFVSGDGETNRNPTFQNIFVYLGDHKDRFATVFGRIGYVMERIDVETGRED